MNGQWIGRYHGGSTGLIVVNIDERPAKFQGVAYLNVDNKALPSVAAGSELVYCPTNSWHYCEGRLS
jgi:hypothetical protein